MLCEKCKKNEATVFYRENVNGKEKKYLLCADCASELEKKGQISLGGDFGFDGFFGDHDPIDSLFSSLFSPAFKLTSSANEKHCPLCGSTFSDIVEMGKVGCPECYAEFRDELEPTLRRIHGKSSHSGRAPAKLKEKLERKKEIFSLENEMKEAVKNQEFERAAELRDKLKALKDENK